MSNSMLVKLRSHYSVIPIRIVLSPKAIRKRRERQISTTTIFITGNNAYSFAYIVIMYAVLYYRNVLTMTERRHV
jgi:hypothetical protein